MSLNNVRFVFSAILLCVALPVTVSAQGSSGSDAQPDPGRAIIDTQAALDLVEREASCISARRQELTETVRLMREALVQHNRSAAGSADRQAASDTVRSLIQRRTAILQRVPQCRQEIPVSHAPPEGVVVRDPPLDAAAQRVAQRNPATTVYERDVRLVTNVQAVVGERVDGLGQISANAVRAGIRSIASELGRCYDRSVGRGALPRGRLILNFTVTPTGRVTRVRAEGNTMGSNFGRCALRAGRRMRITGTQNGDVGIAYTLSFPE